MYERRTVKVDENAMIRNRYNRISHPAPDTNREQKTNSKDDVKYKTNHVTRNSVFGIFDQDSNRPAQLQILARVLKVWIYQV